MPRHEYLQVDRPSSGLGCLVSRRQEHYVRRGTDLFEVLGAWLRSTNSESEAASDVELAFDRSTRSVEVLPVGVRSLSDTFQALSSQWEQETALESSVERMALHPAYQRIVGMGPAALPLIMRDLQQRPQHWFWALRAITGEDPAAGEETIAGAASAWLRWGGARGFI